MTKRSIARSIDRSDQLSPSATNGASASPTQNTGSVNKVSAP